MTETPAATPAPVLTGEQLLEIIEASSRGGAQLPRHRHNLTPEQVEESQRWRLIAATAEVIAEQGYAKTTVDQISAQAGVSKKSFYKFFSDKEDAFLSAYDTIGAVLVTMQEGLPKNPRSLEEVVRAVLEEYLRLLQAAPAMAKMFLLNAQGSTKKIAERRILGQQGFAYAFSTWLDESGIEHADIDHREFVAALGGVAETCAQQAHLHGVDTLDDVADILVSFLMRVLSP